MLEPLIKTLQFVRGCRTAVVGLFWEKGEKAGKKQISPHEQSFCRLQI
jgi:hypothetical protein